VKLLYVTSIFPYGTWETFFRAEVRTLSKDDDVLVVATRPQQKEVVFEGLGMRSALLYNWTWETLGLAAREFVRSPRDVLGALGMIALPRYRLAAKLKNLSLFPKALALAHIVRRERIDHIHALWITTPATIAYIASRLTAVPWSITAHQHDIFSDNLLTAKVRDARFTRVISARNCRHLQEFLTPDAAARCTVIHLGVEIPPSPAEPAPRDVPTLVCGARFGVWKGHTVLIDALVELRRRGLEFRCDFAGDGELRDVVEKALAQSGLGERVRLLGTVEHEALLRSMSDGQYDCFVLASTEAPGEHEGIPIAIMEAMAAGLPVVSTRTGSIDELVTPETGTLVTQRDAMELADALEPLLRDSALRRELGSRARQHVQKNFSTEATTKVLRGKIAANLAQGGKPSSIAGSLQKPTVFG
jgi:colanic acid/amylovoran biosynthesis glycosyltransferase